VTAAKPLFSILRAPYVADGALCLTFSNPVWALREGRWLVANVSRWPEAYDESRSWPRGAELGAWREPAPGDWCTVLDRGLSACAEALEASAERATGTRVPFPLRGALLDALTAEGYWNDRALEYLAEHPVVDAEIASHVERIAAGPAGVSTKLLTDRILARR